jgi:hypothetical protein
VTEIELTEHTLIVHVKGADKFWALKSKLEIPLTHVIGAEIDPAVEAHWEELINARAGLKVAGTHVPGVITAGTFYAFRECVFWDVHNPQQAISITLAHEHYTKLVIEVTDPTADIARIEEAVQAHKAS